MPGSRLAGRAVRRSKRWILRRHRGAAILTALLLLATLVQSSPVRAAESPGIGSSPSPSPTSTPTPTPTPTPSPSPTPTPDPGSGPPPPPIPEEKREPPRPPAPEVEVIAPPDFFELYGDSESHEQFLASLEENVEAATELGSTYKVPELGEGDHLTHVTLEPQNFLNEEGEWQKIDTSLVYQSQGPQQAPESQSAVGRRAQRSPERRSGSEPGLQTCTEGGWTNQAGPIEVFFPQQVPCFPISFIMEEGSLLVTPLEIDGQVNGTMQEDTVTWS